MLYRESNLVPRSHVDVNHGMEHLYAMKEARYFAGARRDLLDLLPSSTAASVLEVGCGQGGTGALAIAAGKCGTYCAVELSSEAGKIAAQRLSDVVIGDVERVQLPWQPASFDVLIMSEVLEHLIDPWSTLRRLRPLLRNGATVLASSPNVSHYRIISMLLRGEWRHEDSGPMDQTHLRWFTPRSYKRAFESSGFAVDAITPVAIHGWKARVVICLSLGCAFHLVTRQLMLQGHAV
jgi:2-polyprenyl-3-methyl-5-hydroxy-6-metoxy-1,4-benzoquinol methylase